MDADKEKSLINLTITIEKCIMCYEGFMKYPTELRLKFRRWYNIDPWFFPPKNDLVKGFLGAGDVVFICMRPSTGTFPSPADEQFYKLLKNNGFQDAHITDLVKCRSRVKIEKRKEEKEVENCFGYLLKELEIIEPSLIVAVGDKAYNYLNGKLPQRYKDRLDKIIHYSYAKRWGKEQVLEKDFKRVRQRYHKAAII